LNGYDSDGLAEKRIYYFPKNLHKLIITDFNSIFPPNNTYKSLAFWDFSEVTLINNDSNKQIVIDSEGDNSSFIGY
jgi:hypothetical protein